jgi:hypothetical protein
VYQLQSNDLVHETPSKVYSSLTIIEVSNYILIDFYHTERKVAFSSRSHACIPVTSISKRSSEVDKWTSKNKNEIRSPLGPMLTFSRWISTSNSGGDMETKGAFCRPTFTWRRNRSTNVDHFLCGTLWTVWYCRLASGGFDLCQYRHASNSNAAVASGSDGIPVTTAATSDGWSDVATIRSGITISRSISDNTERHTRGRSSGRRNPVTTTTPSWATFSSSTYAYASTEPNHRPLYKIFHFFLANSFGMQVWLSYSAVVS